MEDEDKKLISESCPHNQWVLSFLRMIDGAAGYTFQIKYLMKRHEEGVINEDDMVYLCRAVRYSYGMVSHL